MGYLTNRYKGKYRMLVEVDKLTNQFPRDLNGTYEDCDVYIDCSKNIKVFYVGNGVLQAYIPSLQTGHNIIKNLYYNYINNNNVNVSEKTITTGLGNGTKIIYSIIDTNLYENELKNLTKKDIIFNIEETDEEVLFQFKADNDEKIFPLLKPKTSGANRSPFSSKNLPKSDYTIPDEDMALYKELTVGMTIESGAGLKINQATKSFLESLTNKNFTMDNLKSDMAKQCMKPSQYIHSQGLWLKYIEHLKKNL